MMKQTVSRLQIHCSVIITALICTGNRKDRPVACCSHATCSLLSDVSDKAVSRLALAVQDGKYQMEVNNEIMEIVSFEKEPLRRWLPSWITSCSGWMTSADSTGRRRQNDGWTAMPSAGNCVSARGHCRPSVTTAHSPYQDWQPHLLPSGRRGTGHCGCGRETERGEMERQRHLAVSIKDKPYE